MNDRAVSPVIGVVLMVGITVILSATVATFVFGFSGTFSNNPPMANVAISDVNTTSNEVTIMHQGGAALTTDNTEEIRIMVDGVEESTINQKLSAGEKITVSAPVSSGETVSIVWVGEEQSVILDDRKI